MFNFAFTVEFAGFLFSLLFPRFKFMIHFLRWKLLPPSQLSLIILECQIVPLGVDYINQGEGENISPGCSPLRSPLQKGHKMTISVAQRIEQAVAEG